MRARAAIALLAALLGCAGPLVNIAPVPPEEYSEAGSVEGKACGLLLFGIMPMGVNERVEKAYERALEKARATSLTDTTVDESWSFTPLGPMLCTAVEGTALVRSGNGARKSPPPRAELREVPRGAR